MSAENYLDSIILKYQARNLTSHAADLTKLRLELQQWASSCFVAILDSGSRAKGTAISLASDVDLLVSLTAGCNANDGGLKGIYDSLHARLSKSYPGARKQNVSVRLKIRGLEVDVTPARLQPSSSDHWIYLSKLGSYRQTNTQKHVTDILNSGRTKEIRVLKIWRELNGLDFPSVYLEYLITQKILLNRPAWQYSFATNSFYILQELARDTGNPLYSRIVDPANSTNILSDLLSDAEKKKIIAAAKTAASQQYWSSIVW